MKFNDLYSVIETKRQAMLHYRADHIYKDHFNLFCEGVISNSIRTEFPFGTYPFPLLLQA
jgi:hypothetical protein